MLRRILLAGAVLVAPIALAEAPAGACSNCLAGEIGKGITPYMQYRKVIDGREHVCFKYWGRPDRCFPLAAATPAPSIPWGGLW